MFATTATVPKNAVTTTHLFKDELLELYQLTRSTWLTPVDALTPSDLHQLAHVTLELFPCVQPPTNQPTGYNKPLAKRWADYDEEDNELPPLPACWFKS